MQKLGWVVVVTGIALALPAYAADRAKPGAAQALVPPTMVPQGLGDAAKHIYRVSGVRDDGAAAHLGVATSFHCTNWSNVPEKLGIVAYNYDGKLVRSNLSTIGSQRTFTISTHATKIFDEDVFWSPGADINQGFVQIYSTTTNIYCSAMIVDAASFSPVGISLHLVRFNPYPGTSE